MFFSTNKVSYNCISRVGLASWMKETPKNVWFIIEVWNIPPTLYNVDLWTETSECLYRISLSMTQSRMMLPVLLYTYLHIHILCIYIRVYVTKIYFSCELKCINVMCVCTLRAFEKLENFRFVLLYTRKYMQIVNDISRKEKQFSFTELLKIILNSMNTAVHMHILLFIFFWKKNIVISSVILGSSIVHLQFAALHICIYERNHISSMSA